MGGRAAKERRRLQRLALQTSEKSDKPSETSRWPVSSENHVPPNKIRNPNVGPKQERKMKGSEILQGRLRRHPPTSDGLSKSHKKQITPKKSKVRKPKHLKRKLLHADGDNRDRIVNAIKEWEEQKLARRETRKRKRTGLNPAPLQTSKPPVGHKDTSVSVVGNRETSIERSNGGTEISDTNARVGTLLSGSKDDQDSAKVSGLMPVEEEHVNHASDSESEVSLNEDTKRTRGRRRRGRKSRDGQSHDDNRELDVSSAERLAVEKNSSGEELESRIAATGVIVESHLETVTGAIDARRCLGRKPVTDFVVGQRYTGKVVYIKPFGAFFDIGCHSDAFCHISRIRDDYVESPNDVLGVGDQVNPRVVEVDRKNKRLTVSLQSDARIEDERVSQLAKKARAEKKQSQSQASVRKPPPGGRMESSFPNPEPTQQNLKNLHLTHSLPHADLKRQRKLLRRAERRALKQSTVSDDKCL